LEGYNLQQPVLEKAGSSSPIVQLAGYGYGVADGLQLNFAAEDIQLWQSLIQPLLAHGVSQAPDTPLEGSGVAMEQGSPLNFGYMPIREARSLILDDLTVSDLLGL
jgi:hypothetical protein